MNEIKERVESYLLARRDWVPGAELAERFGVPERRLRALDNQPGYCTEIAISSSKKGFKHIVHATTAEWLEFKHGLRKHGIRELVRVRDLDRRRAQVTRELKRPPIIMEKDSNQLVMI